MVEIGSGVKFSRYILEQPFQRISQSPSNISRIYLHDHQLWFVPSWGSDLSSMQMMPAFSLVLGGGADTYGFPTSTQAGAVVQR